MDAWGKDWYTALVLKEILCGAGSSLLYDNVRQKNGLCYYIGGKIMRFRMAYVIDAGVAPGNEEKTVELIDESIKNFITEFEKLKGMLGAKKEKLTDSLGKDMKSVSMDDLKRIDVQAKKLGLSRSSYCLQAILKDVKKHPKQYLLQKKFESKAIKGDKEEYHVCVGSYVVQGKHAGYYARISTSPRIDSNAADIPVLIERNGGQG